MTNTEVKKKVVRASTATRQPKVSTKAEAITATDLLEDLAPEVAAVFAEHPALAYLAPLLQHTIYPVNITENYTYDVLHVVANALPAKKRKDLTDKVVATIKDLKKRKVTPTQEPNLFYNWVDGNAPQVKTSMSYFTCFANAEHPLYPLFKTLINGDPSVLTQGQFNSRVSNQLLGKLKTDVALLRSKLAGTSSEVLSAMDYYKSGQFRLRKYATPVRTTQDHPALATMRSNLQALKSICNSNIDFVNPGVNGATLTGKTDLRPCSPEEIATTIPLCRIDHQSFITTVVTPEECNFDRIADMKTQVLNHCKFCPQLEILDLRPVQLIYYSDGGFGHTPDALNLADSKMVIGYTKSEIVYGKNDKDLTDKGAQKIASPIIYAGEAWRIKFKLNNTDVLGDNWVYFATPEQFVEAYGNTRPELLGDNWTTWSDLIFIASHWCARNGSEDKEKGNINLQTPHRQRLGLWHWILGPLMAKIRQNGVALQGITVSNGYEDKARLAKLAAIVGKK